MADVIVDAEGTGVVGGLFNTRRRIGIRQKSLGGRVEPRHAGVCVAPVGAAGAEGRQGVVRVVDGCAAWEGCVGCADVGVGDEVAAG